MSIKDTDKIINEGLAQIDTEVKQEDEIKEKAKYIANLLKRNNNKSTKIEFNNEIYTLGMREHKAKGKIILMALSDTLRRRALIANKPALPGTYTGEYNSEFTLEENIIAVVEAFLFNVIGEIKIATQDDGDVTIIKEKK